MKNIRLLLALAVASFVTVNFVNAVEAHKEAAKAKCCMNAEKKGEKCGHECCVAAAKDGKGCEKCGAPKEEKKEEKK